MIKKVNKPECPNVYAKVGNLVVEQAPRIPEDHPFTISSENVLRHLEARANFLRSTAQGKNTAKCVTELAKKIAPHAY